MFDVLNGKREKCFVAISYQTGHTMNSLKYVIG